MDRGMAFPCKLCDRVSLAPVHGLNPCPSRGRASWSSWSVHVGHGGILLARVIVAGDPLALVAGGNLLEAGRGAGLALSRRMKLWVLYRQEQQGARRGGGVLLRRSRLPAWQGPRAAPSPSWIICLLALARSS